MRCIVSVLLCSALLAVVSVQAADKEPPFVNIGLSSGSSLHGGTCSPHDPAFFLVTSDMSDGFYSHDAGKTWHLIHHKYFRGTGNIAPAAYHPTDPNLVCWNQDAALKITHDKGVTWQPYCAKQPWADNEIIRRMYFDPDYPSRLFVGTQVGLYFTDDEGKTWTTSKGTNGRVYKIAAERTSPQSKRTYFVGTEEGVFRSDDGGVSFEKKVQGLPAGKVNNFVGASNDQATILYVTLPCQVSDGKLTGGVYSSKDKAQSWQSCMNPQINMQTKNSGGSVDIPEYTHITASDKNPSRVYVFSTGTSYYPPNHTTIYRSDDAGGSWRATYFSDPRFKDPPCNVPLDWQTEALNNRWQAPSRALEINSANPDMLVLSQERWYIYTTNGGADWNCAHTGTRVVKDGQVAWINNGLMETSSWYYYIDPFEKNRHYIAQTDIGFSRSLDGGKTWFWGSPDIPQEWCNTTYELAFDPEIKGKIFGAFSSVHDIPNYNSAYGGHFRPNRASGGIAVSLDFGKTWTKLGLQEKLPVTAVVLDPKSPKGNRTLYASVFDGGVYRSTDDGKTWQAKNNGLGSDKNRRSLKIAILPDGSLLNLVTGKIKGETDGVGLYRSTDQGENWTNIAAGQPWTWVKDFNVNPRDPNDILVAASRDQPGLYRTRDGGKTWQNIANKGRETFSGFFHPNNKGWIYFTLTEGPPEAGLYLSKDDGKTWLPFLELPFSSIMRLTFDPDDPKHMYATTFGYSVMKIPVEP